jgi:hypothetical protein
MSDETALTPEEHMAIATAETWPYAPVHQRLVATIRRLDAELVAARRERDECASRSKALWDTAMNAEARGWHSALDAVKRICEPEDDSEMQTCAFDVEDFKALRSRHLRPDMPPPAPPAEKVCRWTWLGGLDGHRAECDGKRYCFMIGGKCPACGGRISVKEETT